MNNMEDYTEEELFEDDGIESSTQTGAQGGGAVDEVIDTVIGEGSNGGTNTGTEEDGGAGPVQLDGVERFLSNYGIKGGMIEFEDGNAAHFTDLSPEEQENILESLTVEAIPTVEEKYNLDESEINLLNILRESEQTPEEFINNLVDYRLGHALAQRDASSIDYENMPADSMYIRHLLDTNPDMSDDDIAAELEKAKELSTFEATVNTIKDAYKAQQELFIRQKDADSNAAFYDDLEMQREEVVQVVENIDDIAGAPITDDMKEYLLEDIMELNEERDPILMEKIFSDPQTMFEVNWFLNYGKDRMKAVDDYWKKEVSKAAKEGYNRAIRGMSGEPVARGYGKAADPGISTGGVTHDTPGVRGFGEITTEEDLFE
jgi:hypothetical protein